MILFHFLFLFIDKVFFLTLHRSIGKFLIYFILLLMGLIVKSLILQSPMIIKEQSLTSFFLFSSIFVINYASTVCFHR